MFLYIAMLLSFSMLDIRKCGYWIHIILCVVFMFVFPDTWKLQANLHKSLHIMLWNVGLLV